MKFRLPHVGIYRQPLRLTQELCMQRERVREGGERCRLPFGMLSSLFEQTLEVHVK